MFKLTLTYENDCGAEELEPIKADIISGMSLADLMEEHDDWYYTDSAIIELAIDNGWDIEAAMHSDEIDEILNDGTKEDFDRLLGYIAEAESHARCSWVDCEADADDLAEYYDLVLRVNRGDTF